MRRFEMAESNSFPDGVYMAEIFKEMIIQRMNLMKVRVLFKSDQHLDKLTHGRPLLDQKMIRKSETDLQNMLSSFQITNLQEAKLVIKRLQSPQMLTNEDSHLDAIEAVCRETKSDIFDDLEKTVGASRLVIERISPLSVMEPNPCRHVDMLSTHSLSTNGMSPTMETFPEHLRPTNGQTAMENAENGTPPAELPTIGTKEFGLCTVKTKQTLWKKYFCCCFPRRQKKEEKGGPTNKPKTGLFRRIQQFFVIKK